MRRDKVGVGAVVRSRWLYRAPCEVERGGRTFSQRGGREERPGGAVAEAGRERWKAAWRDWGRGAWSDVGRDRTQDRSVSELGPSPWTRPEKGAVRPRQSVSDWDLLARSWLWAVRPTRHPTHTHIYPSAPAPRPSRRLIDSALSRFARLAVPSPPPSSTLSRLSHRTCTLAISSRHPSERHTPPPRSCPQKAPPTVSFHVELLWRTRASGFRIRRGRVQTPTNGFVLIISR